MYSLILPLYPVTYQPYQFIIKLTIEGPKLRISIQQIVDSDNPVSTKDDSIRLFNTTFAIIYLKIMHQDNHPDGV